MHQQHDDFAVIATPTHLRAAESVEQPVAVLFHDPVLDTVAQLRLTPERARVLADALIDAADAADQGQRAEPTACLSFTERELALVSLAVFRDKKRQQEKVDAGLSVDFYLKRLEDMHARLTAAANRLDAADATTTTTPARSA